MKLSYAIIIAILLFNCISCKQNCPLPSVKEVNITYEAKLGKEVASGFLFGNYMTTPLPEYSDIFVGVWTHGGTFYRHRFIVNIDLGFIPENAVIDSAYITFYPTDNASSANISPGQYNNYGNNAMYLEKITSVWEEESVAWANQPITTIIDRVSIPSLGSGNRGTGKISILSFVKGWVAQPDLNHGMMLKFQDENTLTLRRVIFASNNHPMEGLRPLLQVYYRKKKSSAFQ